MRRSGLMVLAGLVSGCSLLVQFDPETQLCDSAGACGLGYFCSDAGLCKSNDGGVVAPVDAGGTDASTCTTRETACGDGLDNDCDTLRDCADPDCTGVGCDDRDPCTTGETCGAARACQGGTAMICNSPPTPACQAMSGSCQADAGRCVYMSLSDGTLCGTGQSSRCCAGTCINIGVNSANCGGCGLACATGQTCQPLERSNCASAEPVNTSGRCTCAAGAACPYSQSCSNALCKPLSNAQCAPGESIGDGGVCLTYCRY